ncbi:MAG: FAD:protein FMN transferase [Actinomycetota bacterium]|nr:FAD:protein FMN transferase [Actinomycetota bacterium]
MGLPNAPARYVGRGLGTTVELLCTDPGALVVAADMLRDELERVDRVASRFRDDSELAWVNRASGTAVTVSAELGELIAGALRGAQLSGGLLDPTVGRAVVDLGYDIDFARLRRGDRDDRGDRGTGGAREAGPGTNSHPGEAPGWVSVAFDQRASTLRVPEGVLLDLDSTAKSATVDRAAARIASRVGCGVLVCIGGDLAAAGPPPAGGWSVGVDDVSGSDDSPAVVSVSSGGLATSGTVARSWVHDGRVVHHLIDPRTGEPAESPWRTVSVAAASCVDANIAATGALILGAPAPQWLAGAGLDARLVSHEGGVVVTGAWPAEAERRPVGALRPPNGTGVARSALPAMAGVGVGA